MSKIKKKFIIRDLTTDGLSARDLQAGNTPINYTPQQTASEGNDKISAHLRGLDNALSSIGGGGEVTGSVTINQNQSNASATGLLFDGNTTRTVVIEFSIDRKTTTVEKNESGLLRLDYNTLNSIWTLSQEGSGNAGVTFSVNNSGQVAYSSDILSGVSYSGLMRYSYKTKAV